MPTPWDDKKWISQWNAALAECIADQLKQSDTPIDEWKVSGRRTKENPNKEDRRFWDSKGWEFAKNWADWRDGNPSYTLWTTPDGELANELDLTVDLPTTRLRAILDRVFVFRWGPMESLVTVDLKSGASQPDDLLQLCIQKAAVELKWPGVKVPFGAYFDARRGRLLGMEDLSVISTDQVVELIEDFVKQRDQHVFLPNPGRQCSWCAVSADCAWSKTYRGEIAA